MQSDSLLSKPLVVRQVGQYPFPLQYRVKLRYTLNAIFTSANGATASSASVRLNSCYRPDYTLGSTTQPYQWDQLTSIYALYKVMGARVKVQFWNGSHDGIVVGYRIRGPYDTATSGQSLRLLGETQNCQLTNVATGATDRITYEGYVDLAQVMGWSREQFGAYALGATTANAAYGDIFVDAFIIETDGNTSRTIDYCVSVEYDVQMGGYVSPAES